MALRGILHLWRLVSVSTVGASRWRVCYQRGLPRLVLMEQEKEKNQEFKNCSTSEKEKNGRQQGLQETCIEVVLPMRKKIGILRRHLHKI